MSAPKETSQDSLVRLALTTSNLARFRGLPMDAQMRRLCGQRPVAAMTAANKHRSDGTERALAALKALVL